MGKWFVTQVFQKLFLVHIILFERIYGLKKIGNYIHIHYNLLYFNYLSVKLFMLFFLKSFYN